MEPSSAAIWCQPRKKPYSSKELPLQELFMTKKLVVPMINRQYEWKDKEVGELWDDFVRFFEEGKYTFRLGSFTLYTNTTTHEQHIYNGQSRTITSWLMLMAAAHKYPLLRKEIFQKLFMDTFYSRTFCRNESMNESYKNIPRLSCVNLHDNNFLLHIANKYTEVNDKDGNIRWEEQPLEDFCKQHDLPAFYRKTEIKNAFDSIQTRMNALNYDDEKMYAYVTYLLCETTVEALVCDDEKYASQIFEWENDRGKRVDPADIVKNSILQRLVKQDDRDTFYEKWERIRTEKNKGRDKGELSGLPLSGVQLLHCAIQCYNDCATPGLVISVQNFNHITDMKCAHRYFKIVDDLLSLLQKIQSDRLGKLLISYKLISPEGYFYCLLPIMNKLGFSASLVTLMTQWGIRRKVNRGRTFNALAYTNAMIFLTNEVLTGKITSLSSFEEQLRMLLKDTVEYSDTPEKFYKNLTEASFTNDNNTPKCYLEYIDIIYNTDTYTPPKDVSLEHIIPIKQEEKCIEVSYLGNMTLLEKKNSKNGHRGNSSIKDAPYDAKKISYEESSFKVARQVAENYKDFTAEHIVKRTEELTRILEESTRL